MEICENCIDGQIQSNPLDFCDCVKGQFLKTYHSCDAIDISNINSESFVKNCEKNYKMSTEVFRKIFEKNNCEGNVEMQMWYMFSNGKADE